MKMLMLKSILLKILSRQKSRSINYLPLSIWIKFKKRQRRSMMKKMPTKSKNRRKMSKWLSRPTMKNLSQSQPNAKVKRRNLHPRKRVKVKARKR